MRYKISTTMKEIVWEGDGLTPFIRDTLILLSTKVRKAGNNLESI